MVSHRFEYGLFRLTRWKWRFLPERLALFSGALTGWLAGVVLRLRRSAVDEHLEIAFPEQPRAWRDRVARASYAHWGREAAFLFRIDGWAPERILERVDFTGFEAFEGAAREGEGAMLLTGHLGNWEVAGSAVVASGVALDVVGKGMANRRFEEDLVAARERLGMRVIDMSVAAKEVLRSLGEGRVVAILGDQNAHRSGVFVPFFGRDAATARGTALFALRKDVPVFFGVALRRPDGQRYDIRIRRLDFERTGEVENDTMALLTAYMAALEEAVRSAPEQYFWQHKRWKTRPPEEQQSSG